VFRKAPYAGESIGFLCGWLPSELALFHVASSLTVTLAFFACAAADPWQTRFPDHLVGGWRRP
jgi:hypothetical protein